jgi:hypothetical protein
MFPCVSRMTLHLSVVALAAVFSAVGCAAGGGSKEGQSHEEDHHSSSAKVELRPEHGSGVSGTASFEDASDGVVVQLSMRGLPAPDTLYLAHLHPGTCVEEGEEHEHAEEGQEHAEHAEEGKEHGHGEEIEYPLNQVRSDPEGLGSSTTTLHDTSVEELFSGEPKLVNVHEAGSGEPAILACADLKHSE